MRMENEKMTKFDIDFDYIVANTDTLAILLALAEEASELSQAALKYARALELVKHPTPVSTGEALKKIEEELCDLDIVLRVAQYKKIIYSRSGHAKKIERWANRLREVQKNG